ncbi:hypothetical protein TWF694_006864 [Orbilia ellipsospora]|uniref:Uncharacterized protein n=1 Tax=Orbilia ellipsospora TaxID=2528407 RepID=A0AAV9XLU8_9PEZI
MADMAAGEINGVAKKAKVWTVGIRDTPSALENHRKRKATGGKNGNWKASIVSMSFA